MEGKTMIRKLIVATALVAASAAVNAGPLSIVEGFDSFAGAVAGGWSVNNSNSTPGGELAEGWTQGNSGVFDANSGAPDSYAMASYLNAAPGGSVDNWLITPVVTIKALGEVTFSTKTAGNFPGDNLEVWYNNVGTSSLADFVLLGSVPAAGFPLDWTTYSLFYTQGDSDVRFAFRYAISDTDDFGDFVGLDDVDIHSVPEPGVLSMFALGLLLMPLALRRRRTQA
jgi:PEP-CTERM motif-containing protein